MRNCQAIAANAAGAEGTRGTAGPGRATGGRPTLQTSSNQRNSNRLTRTPVTNVVNPSPKNTIFSEKALRLTTFVTTDQKSTRKTPWIDDVCNNGSEHPKYSTREAPATPTGSGGAWPGFETTRQATRQYTRPHWCGGSGGPGCGTRGRWRGLAGLRSNAPSHTSATQRRRCGGRRRVRRARAGFEARRRTK